MEGLELGLEKSAAKSRGLSVGQVEAGRGQRG